MFGISGKSEFALLNPLRLSHIDHRIYETES